MTVKTDEGMPIHERYPEAYNLMLGFYTNTAFYNSSPSCRPADNVLMAIEYARQKLSNPTPPTIDDAWWAKQLAPPKSPPQPAVSVEQALLEAHSAFSRYTELHLAKKTEDGNAKANANAEMAYKMAAALKAHRLSAAPPAEIIRQAFMKGAMFWGEHPLGPMSKIEDAARAYAMSAAPKAPTAPIGEAGVRSLQHMQEMHELASAEVLGAVARIKAAFDTIPAYASLIRADVETVLAALRGQGDS